MPLDTLAELANDAAEQVETNAQKTVLMAIAAGQALTVAKSQVPHGEWLAWLGKNFNYSQQYASRYMSLSNYARERNLKEASSIREALRMVANDPETPKRDRTPDTKPDDADCGASQIVMASESAAVTDKPVVAATTEIIEKPVKAKPEQAAPAKPGKVTQDEVIAAATPVQPVNTATPVAGDKGDVKGITIAAVRAYIKRLARDRNQSTLSEIAKLSMGAISAYDLNNMFISEIQRFELWDVDRLLSEIQCIRDRLDK